MTVQKFDQWKPRRTMLYSEWIRSMAFWLLDFLSGFKVRKHYVDIKNIMENGIDPKVSVLPETYLNSILKYATKNVEFYKRFKAYDSVKSFPVINKNIIRENYEAFQSPKSLENSVMNMHTSGSTGTPFVVRQDKNKRNRVYAEMIYFWGKAGYQVGMRYVFFRIWTAINKLTAWMRNVLMWSILSQDEGNYENISKTLKSDHKIRMLVGYPGTLENLATYLLNCGDTPEMFAINTIIGIGEAFPKSTHKKLKEVFNCNVVSLYSNQENGMLAQECVENKEFHVNTASYHIELLKNDSDNPVSVGEPGRIVVT
ncbi:MAG: hypothetical protein WAK60_08115, partial [Sedimentisphaerales bacterium]